jgi:hypothetical protein
LPQDNHIVNALVRQALVAIEEVMGANGLKAVLNTSGLGRYVGNPPPDNLEPAINAADYARLNQAVEDFYGRGGPGFLKRIGKASFQYGIREQPALMGIAGVALKVMPKPQRVTFILNSVANALKKSNPQVDAWVESEGGQIAYIERTCAICEGRASAEPVCHLYVGSLGEAVRWATGEDYPVVETHCRAKGDPHCRFVVQLEA